MNLQSLKQKYFETLSPLFPPEEINSFFDITIEWLLNLNKIEIHQSLGKSIVLSDEKKILSVLHRLSQAEPIQYIIGHTAFYGLEIQVDPHVLIPRPETEYLIDLIVKEHKNSSPKTIIDLCTGSGCIALALSKNLPEPSVYAMEYSIEALQLAKQNAKYNGVDVHFIQDDLLHSKESYPVFDLIVSNPPYIRESEKELMHQNVLNYEPEMALFVPDTDPLKFYSAIAEFADKYLAKDGHIYLEINEAFGRECRDLFQSRSYKNVSILKDLDNKDRYLHTTK